MSSHEIVYPRKVSHSGEFLSHDVVHHHGAASRQARSAEDEEVHYRFELEEQELHLELRPVTEFLSGGLVVERHKRELQERHLPKINSSRCHYRGVIRDQPNSRVALSACSDGLVSFFFTFFGGLCLLTRRINSRKLGLRPGGDRKRGIILFELLLNIHGRGEGGERAFF